MEPKEIEGSPERAADRGREEDLGIVLPGTRPSLGDPEVVRSLVAEFAQQVVGVRKGYNADKLNETEALDAIHDLAVEYGRVVMGADESYMPLPWHDPSRLGRRIRLVVPAEDGVEDPGQLLFAAIASSLIDLAVQHEDGNMSDDDVKAKVDEMLTDTVNLILGVR
jgi:hypothetical protein